MTTKSYQSEQYGIVHIQEYKADYGKLIGKKVWIIWLDPEECNDGCQVGEPESMEIYMDNFFEGLDFSDAPEDGFFSTFEEAYEYITGKFGQLNEDY